MRKNIVLIGLIFFGMSIGFSNTQEIYLDKQINSQLKTLQTQVDSLNKTLRGKNAINPSIKDKELILKNLQVATHNLAIYESRITLTAYGVKY